MVKKCHGSRSPESREPKTSLRPEQETRICRKLAALKSINSSADNFHQSAPYAKLLSFCLYIGRPVSRRLKIKWQSFSLRAVPRSRRSHLNGSAGLRRSHLFSSACCFLLCHLLPLAVAVGSSQTLLIIRLRRGRSGARPPPAPSPTTTTTLLAAALSSIHSCTVSNFSSPLLGRGGGSFMHCFPDAVIDVRRCLVIWGNERLDAGH